MALFFGDCQYQLYRVYPVLDNSWTNSMDKNSKKVIQLGHGLGFTEVNDANQWTSTLKSQLKMQELSYIFLLPLNFLAVNFS